MKNIAFVISTLSHGGSERVVSLLANNLSLSNNVTIVLIGDDKNKFYKISDNVKVINLDLLKKSRNKFEAVCNNILRVRKIRAALLQTKPDVVISFLFATNVLVLIASIFLDLKIIVSERNDPDGYKESSRVWNLLRRLVYPLAHCLVVQNKNIYSKFEKYSKKVEIIPNPLVEQVVEKTLVKDSSIVQIMAMGSLSEQKGFDTLIKSFHRSFIDNKKLRLKIFGEGHLRKKLEDLIKGFGLENVVELPGLCKNPPDEFNRSDIFILSSRFEGSPNALLEAMAFGVPCISTNCQSGPSEIIVDEENGILVPVDDVNILSEKINLLSENKKMREVFRQEAPKVMNKYNVENISRQWINL